MWDFLLHLSFWDWLALGTVLLILEVFGAGGYLLWMGIAAGNVLAINYFVAQKYIDALGQVASANNSKVIMMPLEASQMIGSIGGIGEIVKATFGDKKA